MQIARAIAVLCVLFFHLDIAFFSGGFIGVDVFFVLSGYFIARTLLSDGENIGKRQILAFYNRRIRRILPLALFVCLVLMVLGPFLLPTIELKELTKQALASATGWPNLLFVEDDSYFAATLFRPMLHYWSLGVEYQYYAVFPFLFLLTQKHRYAGPALLAAAFAFCVFKTFESQKEAFFWMPTRIWEFMLGFYALRFEGTIRKWNGQISCAAILVILACAVLYDGKMAFPGFLAVVPALATFFMIVCRLPDAKGVLRIPSALMVGIGTLSFSIYLWHFPIVWAAKYQPFIYDDVPTPFEALVVCAVTLFLSVLSYRFIEEPCRNRKVISDRTFYKGVLGAYLLIFGIAFYCHQVDYKVRSYSEKQLMAIYAFEDRLPHRCKAAKKQSKEFLSCYFGIEHESPDKRILLAGNSHADSLKPAFMKAQQDKNINFYLMRESVNPGQKGTSADKFIDAIKERKITDFVFHGLIHSNDVFVEMEKIIEAAPALHVRIHIIDPTPLFPVGIPTDVYTGASKSGLSREEYDKANDFYFEWKKKMAIAHPEVKFYNTADILCPSECVIFNDGHVIYFDSHHLNIQGAYMMSPVVRRIFEGK